MQNIWAGLRGGSMGLVALLVCLLLLGAGYFIQQGRSADRTAEVLDAALVQPEPEPSVDSTPAVEGSPEEVAEEAPEVMTAAPAFDEVRREADGVTVIAGRGAPGSVVSVLQNGVEIASSTVDRSGKFATLAVIPPDGLGHSLTLSQQTAAGPAKASDGEILLAPLAAPIDAAPAAVAEAVAPVVQGAEVSTANVEGAPQAPQAPEQEVVETVAVETNAPTAPSITAEVVTDVGDLAPEAVEAPAPRQSQAVASLELAPSAPPTIPDAPQQAAVLRSTADGVELLNPELPEVMDNVAIDTISYSAAGEVLLAGRAQRDATSVRVYLNNKSIVTIGVDAQGRWRGDVPDVDEGIYTLRVDEVTDDGKVSSRVETPFKREAPEVLAAATAAAAANSAITAITVQKGATLWAIARERYGEGQLFVRVFEANKDSIRDPNLIYPGQIFELPK